MHLTVPELFDTYKITATKFVTDIAGTTVGNNHDKITSLARPWFPARHGGTTWIFRAVIEELGSEERKRVESNERETLQRDAISFREEGHSNRRAGGQIERRKREKERARKTEAIARARARTRPSRAQGTALRERARFAHNSASVCNTDAA